ncbi:hypothetical protein E4U21_004655 [Claviceps maximensis]|nr:hypothetical protein E4U21_004655 [Claviceps maximensis]
MCHRGPCPSCPEAIFTEISCDCGRTTLQPPQPCGSRPPECRFNCQRRPNCGHPAIEHNCHSGDISCPKCPFLVERWCSCGKEKLHSQPCHVREARCGRVCDKILKCGLHKCKNLCHRTGECEDFASAEKHCKQPCGKRKLLCEHLCQNTCHGQTRTSCLILTAAALSLKLRYWDQEANKKISVCDESSACTAKAAISCPCGLRQQQVKCLASSLNPTPSRPDIKCDDECLRLERNRRLAVALNIDPASHQNDHVPYTDLTLKLFKENASWAEFQEREFRVFAKSPNETRLRFKPMISTLRQFLHNLAKDYGLESKSEDIEPYRYVVVFKGLRFASAPLKTLAQCVKIKAAQAAEAATSSSTTSRAISHLPPRAEPFNGFLLINPRFGLTIDEVTSALQSDLAMQPSIHFKISFLPSEEILLRAITSYSAVLSPSALEQVLTSMKARLVKSIEALGLAGNILLCHADSGSSQIIHRDDFNKTDSSGWSAVAGRGAVKLKPVPPVEEPVSRSGRVLIGIRKKQSGREKSWTGQLDRDVEC